MTVAHNRQCNVSVQCWTRFRHYGKQLYITRRSAARYHCVVPCPSVTLPAPSTGEKTETGRNFGRLKRPNESRSTTKVGLAVTQLRPVVGLLWWNTMCGKPEKIGSDSVLNNRTAQEVDIRSDCFSAETACNLQSKLKLTNLTLLAFTLQIKNVLKHDLNRVFVHSSFNTAVSLQPLLFVNYSTLT